MAARKTVKAGMMMLMAALAAGGQASAADMPLRGSLPGYGETAPNWGGVYVGGFYGYSSATINPSSVIDAFTAANSGLFPGGPFLYSSPDVGGSRAGGTFGGFIGYQAQYEDAVIGVEMDYTRVNIVRSADRYAADGSITTVVPTIHGPAGTYAFTDQQLRTHLRMSDYMTFRLRGGWDLGYFMPFMTAGLAVGRGAESAVYTANVCATGCVTPTPTTLTYTKSVTTGGIAYGAGVDMRLAQYILLRAEYQGVTFARFGSGNSTTHTVRAGIGIKY